jgi:hypothetical protein
MVAIPPAPVGAGRVKARIELDAGELATTVALLKKALEAAQRGSGGGLALGLAGLQLGGMP